MFIITFIGKLILTIYSAYINNDQSKNDFSNVGIIIVLFSMFTIDNRKAFSEYKCRNLISLTVGKSSVISLKVSVSKPLSAHYPILWYNCSMLGSPVAWWAPQILASVYQLRLRSLWRSDGKWRTCCAGLLSAQISTTTQLRWQENNGRRHLIAQPISHTYSFSVIAQMWIFSIRLILYQCHSENLDLYVTEI